MHYTNSERYPCLISELVCTNTKHITYYSQSVESCTVIVYGYVLCSHYTSLPHRAVILLRTVSPSKVMTINNHTVEKDTPIVLLTLCECQIIKLVPISLYCIYI